MSYNINGVPIIENVGTLALYNGTTDPNGWLICDGQSRANTNNIYENLNTVIGGLTVAYSNNFTNNSTINLVGGGSATLIDVRGIAISNNSIILLADRAGTGLYISLNNGTTWATVLGTGLPAISFSCVDISSDGTKMIAASNTIGQGLFLSTNTGSTWSQLYTNNGLSTDLISMDNGSNKVAISNDGTKIAVAYTNGYVYYSSNSGATFQIVSPATATGTSLYGQNVPKNYWGLGMSKDGTKLVTAVNNGSLIPDLTKISFVTNPGTGLPATGQYITPALSYSGQIQAVSKTTAPTGVLISTNYGNNWTFQTSYGASSGQSLCVSGNGKFIMTRASTDLIVITSDYGNNWRVTPIPGGNQLACSATGQYIVSACDYNNSTYSTNFGNSFTAVPNSGRDACAAVSSTGQYMFVAGLNTTQVCTTTDYGKYWKIVTNCTSNLGCGAVSGNGQYVLIGSWAGGPRWNLSSNYGTNYTIIEYTAGLFDPISMSYTGQIMLIPGYYSTNYGKSFIGISGYYYGYINATGQYILATSNIHNQTGTIKLATFPYYSNGQNFIGVSWSAISGNGLPATTAYQCIQYSYSGQYVLIGTTTFAVLLSLNYGNSWLGTSSGISWPTGSSNNVIQVGVSNDGKYMTAVNGKALLSTNYGYNWTQSPGGLSAATTWQETSISGNGQYILFATGPTSPVIWLSSSSGATFYQLTNFTATAFQNIGPFQQICISNTGQYILVATSTWPKLSTSYGQYWTQQPGTGLVLGTPNTTQFFGPAGMSQEGKYMLIMQQGGSGNGNFWLSSNSGAYWRTGLTGLVASNGYQVASVSASGQYMIISNSSTTTIYWSTDYGSNWRANPNGLTSIAYKTSFISPNAQYAIFGTAGTLYSSAYNSESYWIQQNQIGQNWTANPGGLVNANWRGAGVSLTGQYMLVVRDNGSSYLSINYGNIFTAISAIGTSVFVCSMSYSGQYMITCTYSSTIPYFTSSYGSNWNQISALVAKQYRIAKISGNGEYMLIGDYANGGNLYLSSNFGISWITNPGIGISSAYGFSAGGVSYTGQYMFAQTNVSSNYGKNWRQTTPTSTISSLGAGNMSGTGQFLIVATGVDQIWISSNYGISFVNSGYSGTYPDCGISYTGQYMMSASSFSTNYGVYFYTPSTFNGQSQGSTISPTGSYILKAQYGGSIYLSVLPNVDGGISYSSDSGNNWIAGRNLNDPFFDSVSISADGSTVLAGTQGRFTYISTSTSNTFSPILSLPTKNTYGTALSSTGQYGIISQQSGGLFTTSSYGSNWSSGVVSSATITDSFYGGASISQNGQVLVATAGSNVYLPIGGPLTTFTPFNLSTVTTTDATTLRYIIKY